VRITVVRQGKRLQVPLQLVQRPAQP
jgi:hypothetical protein